MMMFVNAKEYYNANYELNYIIEGIDKRNIKWSK